MRKLLFDYLARETGEISGLSQRHWQVVRVADETEPAHAFTCDQIEVCSRSATRRVAVGGESFVQSVAAEGIGANADRSTEDVRTLLPYDRVSGQGVDEADGFVVDLLEG